MTWNHPNNLLARSVTLRESDVQPMHVRARLELFAGQFQVLEVDRTVIYSVLLDGPFPLVLSIRRLKIQHW